MKALSTFHSTLVSVTGTVTSTGRRGREQAREVARARMVDPAKKKQRTDGADTGMPSGDGGGGVSAQVAQV